MEAFNFELIKMAFLNSAFFQFLMGIEIRSIKGEQFVSKCLANAQQMLSKCSANAQQMLRKCLASAQEVVNECMKVRFTNFLSG